MILYVAERQDYVGFQHILGVFRSEQDAIDACECEADSVFPVELDRLYPNCPSLDGSFRPVVNAKVAADSLGNDWLDGYVPREV